MNREMTHRCARAEEENKPDLKHLRALLFPVSEYREEYSPKDSCKKISPINTRFTSAGMPSKGKPDYQPLEYDSSDGIVPRFKGESTAKSSFRAQPPISKLPMCKPPTETREPMLLGPEMTEVEPYSHSVHCPMPQDLARQTAQVIPLWIRDKLKPMEYKPRYDLTTCYQSDFCGVQTKPRKICLRKNSTVGSDTKNKYVSIDGEAMQKQDMVSQNQEMPLWNHINSLLYRSTNDSTYLPPSVFGKPECHPTKYPPND